MKTWNKGKVLTFTGLLVGSLCATGVAAKSNPGVKNVDQLTAGWYGWQQTHYSGFDFGAGLVDCGLGQKGEIWYLGGTGGADPVERECMDPIPAGKRLFFPLINANWANEDYEDLSVEEKRAVLDGLLGDMEPGFLYDEYGLDGTEACKLSASVDGVPVTYSGTAIQRVQSPPFEYVSLGGNLDPEAVSDGFWVMLPKLAPGPHTVEFTGRLCTYETGEVNPIINLDVNVTYYVTVVK